MEAKPAESWSPWISPKAAPPEERLTSHLLGFRLQLSLVIFCLTGNAFIFILLPVQQQDRGELVNEGRTEACCAKPGRSCFYQQRQNDQNDRARVGVGVGGSAISLGSQRAVLEAMVSIPSPGRESLILLTAQLTVCY